jgi:hypothetical protein
MARCLFTNEELGPDTREEHTVPRSLGGRIKSTVVSSSIFNERCGVRLDPYLAEIYAETMLMLGPALPTESRLGARDFDIPGRPGHWRVNEFGQLVLAGPNVIDRDSQTNRPRSAIGPNIASMQSMITQLGSPQFTASEVLPDQTEGVFPERAVAHWAIEVAALKAALLSFDHLLRHDADRFTRAAALEPVREFIRTVVQSSSNAPNVDALIDYSLGVQYDADYLDLYAQLRQAANLQPTPFNHTLIASADQPSHALDIVLWLFDTDPHAFRVTTNWRGESFTYVATNGILAQTQASPAVKLPQSQLLGRYTNRRFHSRWSHQPTAADRQAILDALLERRSDLYHRAVDYAERHCDESLRAQLTRLARLESHGDHRLSTAVLHHVMGLFPTHQMDNAGGDHFLDLIMPIIDSPIEDVLQPQAGSAAVPAHGWPYWLQRCRDCLDVLRPEFGLPGHMFRAASRIVPH